MPTELPPDEAPRVVKPRNPDGNITYRHIIAVAEEGIYLERLRARCPIKDLPKVIATEPSSILVCQGFGRHLQRLLRVFGNDERFNYRVTPKYRGYRQSGTRVYDAVCNFVGFMADENKKNSRYHYPLDPVHFVRMGIDELRPDLDETRLEKLYLWGMEVRDWCNRQHLQVRPSSGGLVAQLLRDPRFYPQPRRKAPRLINDIARTQLPGNYYRLHAEERRRYNGIYLDLTSAHHAMAARIRFPDVNTLHGYGHWNRRERLYVKGSDSPQLKRPGLFLLRLNIPHMPATKFPPPWADRPGIHDVWVYSNEFEMINELRIGIVGIVCAFTSRESEQGGMSAYARWALDEIRQNQPLKPWLKPTLHSTYGVLAARPVPFETGFFRCNGGERTEYPMGPVSIPLHAKKSRKEIESKVANVIHRGMIEAEVRKETLWLARFLTEVDRRDILSVYADSVFVRDNGTPMRLLPPGWRIAEYVTELRFFDATHFAANELVRLPGLSRTRRDAERLDAMIRRDAVVQSAHRPNNRPRRRTHAATQDHPRQERAHP